MCGNRCSRPPSLLPVSTILVLQHALQLWGTRWHLLDKLKSTTVLPGRCILSWYKRRLAWSLPCPFSGWSATESWHRPSHSNEATSYTLAQQGCARGQKEPGSCWPHWTSTRAPHSLPQDWLCWRNKALFIQHIFCSLQLIQHVTRGWIETIGTSRQPRLTEGLKPGWAENG